MGGVLTGGGDVADRERGRLVPWRPPRADGGEEFHDSAAPNSDALLIGDDIWNAAALCDLHALARAARSGVLQDRLFEANARCEGEAWYDRLAHIRRVDLWWVDAEGVLGDRRTALREDGRVRTARPARISLRLQIDERTGAAPARLELPIDVAVGNVDDEWPANGLLIAAGAEPDPLEAAEYLADACHAPRDPDFESDSKEHQRAEFVDRHFAALCRALWPPEEAARRIVEHLARRYLQPDECAVPPGFEVTLTLRAKTPHKAAVRAVTA